MVIADPNEPVKNKQKSDKFNCQLTSIGNLGNVKHEKKHRLKQRFEVKRKLGQGTYGKVQLAINKGTGQEVAIKTIKKSKIESEQDLIRIRREIQIMSSIQHPHIIHIFEVFENKDKIVLVTQYASGGELYEYVSEQKLLSDNEARRLFRQIAAAVYYIHKNKVCHRDLKLENILLDEKGNAKIADFGLSNVFDEKHLLSTFCGSPLYASPEIVKGTPYFGSEVDCWSLGVLLYTLVYGAMPFDGSNFKKLVKQISEASYFEPKQKSDASQLIRRLLSVNPAKRATIIDICTDCWVNKGYEHSLLQVAEDLANLTPVRLDVLLALAPISPTATSEENLLGKENEAIQKKSKPEDKEADEISSKVPSSLYPEEENEEEGEGEQERLADANANDNEEFMKSDVAVSHEEKNQKKSEPKTTKRVASGSFDQSITRVPSHMAKKKKPKKISESKICEESEEKPASSGYASESTTASSKSSSKQGSQKKSHEFIQKSSSFNKPATASFSSINSSLPSQGFCETSSEAAHTLSSTSIETIMSKEMPLTKKQSENDSKIKEPCSLDNNNYEASKKPNEPKDVSLAQKELIQVESTNKSNLINENKEKEILKRKGSVDSKTGKLQPKFQEITSFAENKVGSINSKFSEAKKMFENKKENEEKDKEKNHSSSNVSNVKQAFEKKSLIQTSFPVRKNIEERKSSLPQQEIGNEKENKAHVITKSINQEVDSKDLKSVDNFESSKKILEEVNKQHLFEEKKTGQTQKEPIKDVNKAVSKVKTQESRLSSVESRESISSAPENTDNSNRTTFQFKHYVPSAAKKESKPTSIRSTAEIQIGLQTDVNTFSNKTRNEPAFDLDSLDNIESKKETSSISSTPSIVPTKATPITRSYKKVTFTKDGACITETGKIISEEGADGSFRRTEKKSKVTHYPTGGQSASTTTKECTEETTRTVKSFGGTLDDNSRLGSISPPLLHSGLRKSESGSSSGSTDIFDDIFDTWSGDPTFNNLSGRMKSMLQERSPFSRIWGGQKKKSKKKSKAESCERKLSNDWKKTEHGTDQEYSDTDNENDSSFGLSKDGLWKFLDTKSTSKIFDRQQSLFSKHFGQDHDFFKENDNFGSFTRSKNSHTPSLRMIIKPGKSRVVSSFKTIPGKQDSTESNESRGSETYGHRSYSNKGTVRSISKTFLKEMSDPILKETYSLENEERPSSIRRVEQWLDMSKDDEFDRNHPITMYATLRPRSVTRYGKSMPARADSDSGEETTQNLCESEVKKSFSTSQEFHINSGSNDKKGDNLVSNTEVIHIPMCRNMSGKNKPVIHMKLSLGGPRINHISSDTSFVNAFTEPLLSTSSSPEILSSDWDSPLVLPESSSLLEQLRTHGYRNMVSQRLSGGGGLGERYDNQETSSSPSGSIKRGKSLNQDSSSVFGNACNDLNNEDDNRNCMRRVTNPNNLYSFNNETIVAPQKTFKPYEKLETENKSTSGLKSINALKQASKPPESITALELPHSLTFMSDEKNESINKWSNLNHRSMINSFVNPNSSNSTKETLQERIFRKSYYSRFNNDNLHKPFFKRKLSLLDDDIDSYLRTKYSLDLKSDNSFPSINCLRYDKSSKPPIYISNDEFIQRMQTRAQLLIEEARERQRFALNHFMKRGRDRIDGLLTEKRRSQSMNREENLRRSEFTI